MIKLRDIIVENYSHSDHTLRRLDWFRNAGTLVQSIKISLK